VVDRLDQLGPLGADDLATEWRTQLVVERLVLVAAEAVVEVNTHIGSALLGHPGTEYRASFDAAARTGAISDELAAAMTTLAGLRNVLAHQYADVDLVALLAAGVEQLRADLPRYVAEVSRFLLDRE